MKDLGELMQEELQARRWSVKDLSVRSGLTTSYLSRLLQGEDTLDHRTAGRLGQAFGVSPQLFLNFITR